MTNYNQVDASGGYTMLMLKVEEGKLEDVRALVQKNSCRINAQNRSGQTALSLACRNGNFDIVSFLLDVGADANMKNKVVNCCSLKYIFFLVWTDWLVYC